MADDNDIPALDEQQNEQDTMLRANGYDPSEYTPDEKADLVNDIVGDTAADASKNEPDFDSDAESNLISGDEQDGTDA